MENLKLKDFLDYKYLSNLEFSPNGEMQLFFQLREMLN